MTSQRTRERLTQRLMDQGITQFEVLEAIRSVLEAKKKGRHDSIKVTLLQGRNLPIMDFRKSDPYVKLSMGKGLMSKQKKTSKTISKTLNPTWDEAFEFRGVLRELLATPLLQRAKQVLDAVQQRLEAIVQACSRVLLLQK